MYITTQAISRSGPCACEYQVGANSTSRTRPYSSTLNIPPVSHDPCCRSNNSRNKDPAVAYFCSTATPRFRGVLWPSIALPFSLRPECAAMQANRASGQLCRGRLQPSWRCRY